MSLVDFEKLYAKFDSQFEVSDALREYFETAYQTDNFKITYTLSKQLHSEARIQRNIFFQPDVIGKYNKYIAKNYNLTTKKAIDYRLSKVLTSLAHELANQT